MLILRNKVSLCVISDQPPRSRESETGCLQLWLLFLHHRTSKNSLPLYVQNPTIISLLLKTLLPHHPTHTRKGFSICSHTPPKKQKNPARDNSPHPHTRSKFPTHQRSRASLRLKTMLFLVFSSGSEPLLTTSVPTPCLSRKGQARADY